MTQLLIQGSTILAQGQLVETTDDIRTDDVIYPKHVIEGWQIVDAALPDGFAPAGYTWDGAQVAPRPPAVVQPTIEERIASLKAQLSSIDMKRIRPMAEGDTAFLSDLNSQAENLRAELRPLLKDTEGSTP